MLENKEIIVIAYYETTFIYQHYRPFIFMNNINNK